MHGENIGEMPTKKNKIGRSNALGGFVRGRKALIMFCLQSIISTPHICYVVTAFASSVRTTLSPKTWVLTKTKAVPVSHYRYLWTSQKELHRQILRPIRNKNRLLLFSTARPASTAPPLSNEERKENQNLHDPCASNTTNFVAGNNAPKEQIEHYKNICNLTPTTSDGVDVDIAAFQSCWEATSWTINASDDEEINQMVQCFNSPAPQAYFAFQRALSLQENSVEQTLKIFSYMLKDGHQFAIRQCNDDKNLVDWRIVPPNSSSTTSKEADGWKLLDNLPSKSSIESPFHFKNTLQIAHYVLELETEQESETMLLEQRVNDLVDLALHRLQFETLGIDIRGRSAADAAFAFAMAGVTHPKLFQILAIITLQELTRIGKRPSFPSKNILQIVEKLAAAGMRSSQSQVVQDIFQLAADLLESKEDANQHQDIIRALRNGTFGFHSTRSLLWLWRFATRQKKAKQETQQESHKINNQKIREVTTVTESTADGTMENLQTGENDNATYDTLKEFEDPSRPLIVDIGCGMGVSLLGLASSSLGGQKLASLPNSPCSSCPDTSSSHPLVGKIDYTQCNYLGVDLSRLLVRFGQGIASRWWTNGEGEGRIQFVWKPAERVLQELLFQKNSSPSKNVKMIMIQFPTPYRLGKENANKEGETTNAKTKRGNLQLPSSASSNDFMVSLDLLRLAVTLVKPPTSGEGGYILLQSNCEDVAIAMRDMAIDQIGGMVCVNAESPVTEEVSSMRDRNGLPQRTREWISMNGKRAIGEEWSSKPLLPRIGQTETEVACELQGTPVHRCLLRVI